MIVNHINYTQLDTLALFDWDDWLFLKIYRMEENPVINKCTLVHFYKFQSTSSDTVEIAVFFIFSLIWRQHKSTLFLLLSLLLVLFNFTNQLNLIPCYIKKCNNP